MKILFLMSGSEIGGAGVCLLRLVTQISKENKHKITVINSQEGILNSKLRSLGIATHIIPSIYLKKIYLPSEVWQLLKNAFSLKQIIKKEDPAIIHAFTIPSSRRVIFLKLIFINKPIVGTVHDEFSKQHFGNIIRLYRFSVNKFYSKLISVSNATKEIAIQNGIDKSKIVVIHNGIPISDIKFDNNNDANFSLGTFGRIVYGKGQHVLVESVLKLKNNIPNIKCYIIGQPSLGINGSMNYYEDLKKKIKINSLETNIFIINWTDKIEEYFKKINVYVLSSCLHDPFPTVNLEAMSYRIPVISTNVGGAVEQVIDGETGFLIEPNNPEKLSEKLLFLQRNPNISKRMGENGYDRVVKEFNIEKYTKSHVNLYSDVLNTEVFEN